MINEEFLHFVWKFQLFEFLNLKSTQNHTVQILNKGVHNHNAGPDFLNAKIKIDKMIWCGDVEIHNMSSEWYSHKHHDDENYNSVILHVVYEEDIKVERGGVTSFFCIELKDLIPEKYLTEYNTLYHSISNLPCSYGIGKLDKFFLRSYCERLLVERLEAKAAKVRQIFLAVNKDYQECFYRLFSYSLGLKINAEQMLNLAEETPLLMLQKHRSNRFQIEALLYGQSGLLERKYVDVYPNKLHKEYRFYAEKYRLRPMNSNNWKFFRLRPSSFPSLRISYLADFVLKSEALFNKLFNFKNLKELLPLFNLNTSDYWKYHYVFDKKSKYQNKRIGKSTTDLVFINAILPFCFFYAKMKSDELMSMRVLDAFYEVKSEDNKIIRLYKDAGVKVDSAMSSQALIHLHHNYCIPRNCLNCRVFNQILK